MVKYDGANDGGVGIQVSCSAEDHSAVRDGRSPVSKYSRTSLYIAGHLPHLKVIKQPFHYIHHTFQQVVVVVASDRKVVKSRKIG